MNSSTFITPDLVPEVDMNKISPAPDKTQLHAEVDTLKENIILKASHYVLLVCNLKSHPALRQELGRQREITFRQVGESTGTPLDIDKYDEYYDQLIIWDETAGRLVGGYRFGAGDKIFAAYGREGFYINSFFEMDIKFDEYLPQCLELGRSFIVKDYQKRNLPLYLLWKGILAYQLRNPHYKYLIGPVSISRFYSDFSRKLLMEYAKRYLLHPKFSGWFHPRIPYDPVISVKNGSPSFEEQNGHPDFKNIIDHIRPEHIRFPILMKQYIRQNARFLGFNLDPQFNDALDGLMILDIADIPYSTIELLQREM